MNPDGPHARDAQVWAAVLAHRDRALRVARARCASQHDVDDVVQEAMLRVASMPDLDLSRIGSLLSVVVRNLATDSHRRRARTTRARARLRATALVVPGHDEDVCDALEARWLRRQMVDLAGRERTALELRADGLGVAAIAREMGVSYKAAESALGRARTAMRAVWRATAAALGVMTTARSRNSPSRSAPAYLAATVVTGIIAGSVVGSALPQDQPAPRAAPLSVVEPVRPAPFRTPLALAPAGRTAAEPTKHLPHTAGPSAAVAVVPAVRAGGVEYTGGVLRRRHGDETLLQTIERCARAGVTVAPTRVECNG